MHKSSNYGKRNIDMATPFDQKLTFPLNDGTQFQGDLKGTSYSAAYTSSLLAKHISNVGNYPINAPQTKDDFLNQALSQEGKFSRCIGGGRYMK